MLVTELIEEIDVGNYPTRAEIVCAVTVHVGNSLAEW